MDLDDFRTILGNSGVNIWEFIESAVKVATLDYGDEIRIHRDNIVAKLYANCPNCDSEIRVRPSSGGFESNAAVETVFGAEEGGGDEDEEVGHHQKLINQRSVDDDDDVDDDYDEETRIIQIKEQIEDPHQSEESLVDLLQTLADMDITFKALKETDIGRHVNRLRKHPSNDVKRLVKLLVRKWKDLVDEWVKSNTPGEVHSSNNLIVDGDSPQQNVPKNQQNGHHNQVPDFGYSPNPHNGSSGSDKSEYKPKAVPTHASLPRRDPPAKPITSAPRASAPPPDRQKQVAADPERLASARKRLQENYQEVQNAKKQRTIQVMEINQLPKPKAKNSFFGRNKGGFQRH
ncbi:hypothetical protein RND81_13G209000 [Saponaria officinalis]|uniref:TFIIS N-terminal domain-containing protein n=1 Tax=Saponaria officinalis TaxID=3572 RepID=A0AAW1H3W7_SAPOF